MSTSLCRTKPPVWTPHWWIWMGRLAHCRPVTRSYPPPPLFPSSESTSLSAVTQRYTRQPGGRLFRSNQLCLNTECDGSHYTKSSTAKALTTIDYLNITCIRCRVAHTHICCSCPWREEVDCPPVLYRYCLSFLMTRTVFHRTCHSVLLFLNLWLLLVFLRLLFLCFCKEDIFLVYARCTVSSACFYEVF